MISASLVFSFIGMETQEIAIEGRSEINVVLSESAQALDEVIVVDDGSSDATVARIEEFRSNASSTASACSARTAMWPVL